LYKSVLQESRYIQWNEEVREILMQIWQSNCSEGRTLVCRWMWIDGSSLAKIDRSLLPSLWTVRGPACSGRSIPYKRGEIA